MRRRKVWLLVGVLLLGVAGAGVYLCVFPDDPPPAPPLRAGMTGTEVQEVMAVAGFSSCYAPDGSYGYVSEDRYDEGFVRDYTTGTLNSSGRGRIRLGRVLNLPGG